jgi:tetratricopeptide (TPR) repeat protein
MKPRELGAVARRLRTGFVVLLAFLSWIALVRAGTAEEGRLRIVAHPEFARLVLEPTAARATALDVAGGAAQLRLDRAVAIDVPAVPAAARPFLLAVEARDEGARLALALAPDVAPRLVEPGPGRIVLDLSRERRDPDPARAESTAEPPRTPAALRAPPVEPDPAPRTLRVRRGSHPGFERLVLEGPAVAALEFRVEAERVEIAGPADPLAAVASGLERLGSLVRRVKVEDGVLRAEFAPGARLVRRRGRGEQVLFDIHPSGDPKPRAAEGEHEAPGGRKPTEVRTPPKVAAGSGEVARGPTGAAADCVGARGTSELCVAIRATGESAEVVLDVQPRPGAAVLWRAGALWVVLDRAVDGVETRNTASAGEALVRGVTREPHPTATLLRFDTFGPVRADAEPSPRGWVLRVRPAEAEPTVEPTRIARLETEKALAIEADARLVALPAALLGGEVTVLAAHEMLDGVGPRRFVDLEFLPATQGVAWRAVSDDLRARRIGDRWIFDRPGGLRLAPLDEAAGGAADPASSRIEASGDTANRSDAAAGPSRVERIPPDRVGPAGPSGSEASALAADDERGAAADRTAREGGPAHAGGPDGDRSTSAPAAHGSSTSGAGTGPAPETAPSPERSPSAAPAAAGREPPGTVAETSEPPIGLVRFGDPTKAGLGSSMPELLERRAGADPHARTAIDRELARAALAQGRAAEALAFLGEPAAASDPAADPPAHPSARALTGVAAILSDRLTPGERLLDDPRYSGDAEVALWRAVAAARAADWPRAARALAASGRVFQSYPPALQVRLAPILARAHVKGGKPAAALALVDLARRQEPSPREAARLSLVEGLALLAQGAREAAAASFRAAAEGGDPVSAVEARSRLVRLAAEAERWSPEALLAELGRQRLLWRDHPAEPELLADLAELYAAAGRYGEALALAAELLARHPGAARVRELAERRRDWLRAALEGGAEGPAEALRALRMLRTHAELLPEGEAGATLVHRVAQRLAAAGLPGSAATVLVEHALPRLGGPARTDLVLEAAELRLRAGERDGALALLDAEAGWEKADPAIRARLEALRRAARGPEPPAVASAGVDPTARARFEAGWRERDWPTVVEAGKSLLARGLASDPGTRLVALRVAVALAADGKPEQARELVARFGLEEDEAARRVVGLLDASAPLAGDALQVASAVDGELARLRAGLGRDR